jgi:hyperosmotically inducible protein
MFSVLIISCFAQEKSEGEVSPRAVERLQKEVRHELLMLPYRGVFDNLAYTVDGSGSGKP